MTGVENVLMNFMTSRSLIGKKAKVGGARGEFSIEQYGIEVQPGSCVFWVKGTSDCGEGKIEWQNEVSDLRLAPNPPSGHVELVSSTQANLFLHVQATEGPISREGS